LANRRLTKATTIKMAEDAIERRVDRYLHLVIGLVRATASKQSGIIAELTRLIDENQVKMIGPIRPELLSGYSDKRSCDMLRKKISYFPSQ
jgi:hypothetical protein